MIIVWKLWCTVEIKIPKIDNGGSHITYFIHPDSDQVPDVISPGTTRCNFRSLLLKLSVSTVKHIKNVLKSNQQSCIPRFVFSTSQEHCRLLQAHVQVAHEVQRHYCKTTAVVYLHAVKRETELDRSRVGHIWWWSRFTVS